MKDELKKARNKFMKLLQKIEQMDHLTGEKRFELRMQANCAMLVEEILISNNTLEEMLILNNTLFDLDFVSYYLETLDEK